MLSDQLLCSNSFSVVFLSILNVSYLLKSIYVDQFFRREKSPIFRTDITVFQRFLSEFSRIKIHKKTVFTF